MSLSMVRCNPRSGKTLTLDEERVSLDLEDAPRIITQRHDGLKYAERSAGTNQRCVRLLIGP